MTAPYTTQTITGYNSGAPADDGSQVSTNEIKWSNHKTKLGDPIKTLAEDMNTELLSAFGLVFGQEISVHATDYTIVAGDQGKFLSVTGTTTITLLAAATAGANFPLAIINNGTGVVTVDGSGAETINGSATITLNPGNSIILTCNGTLWIGVICIGFQTSAISGYVSGVTEYLEELRGAGDYYDLEALLTVSSTFESFGPTGSGADNIWTDMDDIPAGAKFIKIKINVQATLSATPGFIIMLAKKTGETDTFGINQRIAEVHPPVTGINMSSINADEIPLDSSLRFDLALSWSNVSSKTSQGFLKGWVI